MSVAIQFKDTIQIRGRADVLFRSVMDPKRRAKWDPSIRTGAYVGEERLVQGAMVRFKLPPRMLGLTFTARYGSLQAPHRGGWESVKPFGPLERFAQGWVFKSIPGGTEVTLSVNAKVRFGFIAKAVERMLRSASAQTLIELQRQVDAAGAQLVLDTARDMAKQQREARKKGKKKN
ncbi:SRPBCC family protein [Deinococcus peraridilitoris]|uniref:Polyketide cyclase / dehydrase and lipid transport n=1 Tax=Deinococcus peraridilitoris (strain DSM 19664 / LMG 22246 / CIP 109416 / KR-200) TaxID=937777 RepID=K9ZW56_DEIPD|nr:SRPBCC family protein [Deinococcus peraridilitoris]AFZ65873.1 Polyketide cyclase / dehydrase and lipid transport [Deinococcus peraridilitoris DSM 19664]